MSNSSLTLKRAQSNTPKIRSLAPSYKVILAYVSCTLIWGTTWYAIRVCVAPGGYPAFLAAALRFSLATLLLVPFCVIFQTKSKPSTIWWIVLAGILSGCGYGLLFKAEEYLSGGMAAVVSAAGPSLALTLAAILKIEKNTWQTHLGSLIALVGIAITYHARMFLSGVEALAVILLLVVCVLHAMANVVVKKLASDTHPLPLNTIFFAASAFVLWLFALFSSTCRLPVPLPNLPTLALGYLTLFGTLITFGSFFYLLKHASLRVAMTVPLVTPLIALVVDAIFGDSRNEGCETYVGIALVLASVLANLILYGSQNKKID